MTAQDTKVLGPIQVLLVEDDPNDDELIRQYLMREGLRFELLRVETEAEYRKAIADKTYDVILSDNALPTFDGMTALRIAREECPEIPFLLVSGTMGEEVAIETLKSGATDYVLKQRLSRLGPSVRRALKEAAERVERRTAESALRESETRFRAYVQSAPEGIFVIDDEGRMLDVNAAAAAMTGYTEEELLNLSMLDLATDGARQTTSEKIAKLLRDGRFEGEGPLRRRDGTSFYASIAAVRLRENRNLCFVQDITRRKEAEAQTKQHLQRLSALYQVERALGSSLDARFTLNVLLDQVTESLGLAAADVLLIQESDTEMEAVASRGFATDAIMQTRVRLAEGCVGRAALERCTVYTDRSSPEVNCPRMELVGNEGFLSHIAIPLVAKGQLKGVLEVFDRQVHQNDALLLEFLETIAGQAAIAIDNAALFQNVQRANAELLMSYDATINGWVSMLELRDLETKGHSQRVTELTVQLCRAMGVAEADIVHARRGALLHDVGKMAIPDVILLKPGPLSPEETALMRTHVDVAHDMLARIPYLRPALDIPSYHHEKWDGSGYPSGMSGAHIPLWARTFAVIDVWDALTSDRPYRAGWPKARALEYIREQAGQHFDPEVVSAFVALMSQRTTTPEDAAMAI